MGEVNRFSWEFSINFKIPKIGENLVKFLQLILGIDVEGINKNGDMT